MARRSALDTRRLRIRRDFDPSRFQRHDLAFAFEQALPIIRKHVNLTNENMTTTSDESHSAARAAGSGAPS
jgi:hypothetical protein